MGEKHKAYAIRCCDSSSLNAVLDNGYKVRRSPSEIITEQRGKYRDTGQE